MARDKGPQEPTPPAQGIPQTKRDPDPLHIDDFLNRTEGAANRELLAAFAFVMRKKGYVKRELAEWQADFERFIRAKPE